MPGLVGLLASGRQPELPSVFARLTATLGRGGPGELESRVAAGGGWALGRRHLGLLNPQPQLTGADGLQVLFHGDLHNERELRQMLPAEDRPDRAAGRAPLIAALYRRCGRAFAAELRGAFAAAVLDRRTGSLVLASDVLGSYPVYWHQGRSFFAFASELGALVEAPDLRPRLEPRAVADLLHFGFLLGDKTLAEGVRVLAPASVLHFDAATGRATIERYRDLYARFGRWQGTEADHLERLRLAFNGAVERAVTGGHRIALALSGGLDSRALLGALNCKRLGVSTYTLGVRGCADQVIARRLARVAGSRHRFLELDESYLGQFLTGFRHMVSLTDGMYLTHGLTEMLALELIARADFQVLLRGHGGELAKLQLAWPLHTDGAIRAMRDRRELVPHLLARFGGLANDATLAELFAPDWLAAMRGQARRSLEESLADRELSAADACAYLYLEEHLRRYTVPSLELFRSRVEVRMPFCDQEFLETLFEAPEPWRDSTAIHKGLIAANDRRLGRIRNSNTGVRADAHPLTELAFDKLNSALKRLNVHGYRHYHDLDRWMTERLVDSVEEVLLAEGAATREMLREDGLRRLVRETRRGAGRHGLLLQLLMTLELWLAERRAIAPERP